MQITHDAILILASNLLAFLLTEPYIFNWGNKFQWSKIKNDVVESNRGQISDSDEIAFQYRWQLLIIINFNYGLMYGLLNFWESGEVSKTINKIPAINVKWKHIADSHTAG